MPLLSASNPIGKPFIELLSIDSTNKYAMTLVRSTLLPDGQGEIQHGTTFFAHEQTVGKGQHGKTWSSEKGSNIALSIVLNPYPLSISEQFKLSVLVAVSVHEFFSRYSGDETKIKWPNDLYWRDRKAGGILIESVVRGQKLAANTWQWAIVGIGLNINQTSFPPNLPNPVSLKQITGKTFVPIELAKDVCLILEGNYQLLVSGKYELLFSKYSDILYKKNEKVKFKRASRIFEATVKGVSETGQLITQHAIEERFEFGSIEWLLNN